MTVQIDRYNNKGKNLNIMKQRRILPYWIENDAELLVSFWSLKKYDISSKT